MRPLRGRRIGLRAAAVGLAASVLIIGCTGENLFTGPVTGGSTLVPTVEITTPGDGTTIAVGDSVLVTAKLTSANGVTQVTMSGVFSSGPTAFISQVISLPTSPDTTISRFLKQAGITTGSAKIIVQASDVFGGTGSDTVSVTIGS